MSEEALRYLSKDSMIDASTCVLPETTWFIKNCYHNVFPNSVNKLFDAFLTTDGMTVFTNEAYGQYLKFDIENDTIENVTGIDEGDTIKNTPVEKASIFVRFMTLVLNFLRKLFSGELNLGEFFGGNESATA